MTAWPLVRAGESRRERDVSPANARWLPDGDCPLPLKAQLLQSAGFPFQPTVRREFRRK